MECVLIFPHQLFRKHPALHRQQVVYLVEEWLFFRQYLFHQQKIILHRASMQAYASQLRQQGHQVHYVSALEPGHDLRQLIPQLAAEGFQQIHLADPVDNWLLQRMQTSARKWGLTLVVYPTTAFINTPGDLEQYAKGRSTYFQTDFYIAQRKKRNILLEDSGKPFGGQWTFDADNRKKLPKGMPLPEIRFPSPDAWLTEAIAYTQQHFSHHYGHADAPVRGGYPWAWTHEGADQLLQQFLRERLQGFGDYEDAMEEQEHFLFHSILTPMLNTGLLEPQAVVDATLRFAAEHPVPLNALEGFLRQILGWREFIRWVYEQKGGFQRTHNYWKFHRKIPRVFWTGQTGIRPVDLVIRKTLATGYAHHIERLMVLGNFFLLCAFDPDEVYRWFMEMYVDAYDWVMVPNVYGMTQFADGGIMTTKPYISGSNYLKKMGRWATDTVPATGCSWEETWDGLFWHFMDKHRDFFGQNPRLGMLLGTLDRMPLATKNKHVERAESYLRWLDQEAGQEPE